MYDLDKKMRKEYLLPKELPHHIQSMEIHHSSLLAQSPVGQGVH